MTCLTCSLSRYLNNCPGDSNPTSDLWTLMSIKMIGWLVNFRIDLEAPFAEVGFESSVTSFADSSSYLTSAVSVSSA